MQKFIMFCPRSDSNHVVKNAFIHNGNQNNKCICCGRQSIPSPKSKVIKQENKDLKNKLLL